MYCPRCKSEILGNPNFCEECGGALLASPPGIPEKGEIVLQGRYTVLSQVGGGAMGAVYRVYDARLDKILALKELALISHNDEEKQIVRDRFREEARILSNLNHPHLPRVIDFFSEEDRHYLVMDYIEGENFKEILKREGDPGLAEKTVKEIACVILRIFECLHEQKPPVLYRDLKPAHIMRRKSDGSVFLVDFGIAKILCYPVDVMGTAIGTEGYSPPEQYKGQGEPRSDLYTLGATMHHLLSGIAPSVPFHFEPVEGISHDMQNVLFRALARHPDSRFSSAFEMRHALEACTGLPADKEKPAAEIAGPVPPAPPESAPVKSTQSPVPKNTPGPLNIVIVTAVFVLLAIVYGSILIYSLFYNLFNIPEARKSPCIEKPVISASATPSGSGAYSSHGSNSPSPSASVEQPAPSLSPVQPSPLPSPPAADEKEVRTILADYNRSMEEKDLLRHISYYADRLDVYYNRTSCPRDYVYKDKQRAIEKYRTIKITMDNVVMHMLNPSTIEVLLDKEWDCRSSSVFAGKERQRLTFRKFNTRWMITGEEELKVYWVKRTP